MTGWFGWNGFVRAVVDREVYSGISIASPLR
jgi:hypothetical protein